MLEIKKISRGFQITLPKAFRDRYNLDIGDRVEIVEEDGRFTLYPFRSSHNPIHKLIQFLDELDDKAPSSSEEEILEQANQQRHLTRKSHENHH